MKVGILGAGVVGSNLAKALVNAGHEIMLSSRNPNSDKMKELRADIGKKAQAGTIETTIDFADVIAIAIGWQNGLENVLKNADWSGKVLIDTTNRFDGEAALSAGEEIAQITGAPVLKAFNTIGAEHLVNPKHDGKPLTMVICGDSAAKEKAQSLVSDIGFDVVDLGDLDQCHLVEALAAVWVRLAFQRGYGRNIALHVLKMG